MTENAGGLLFTSFWGRKWQDDPTRRAQASAIVNGLDALGVGTVLQSSFYTQGGWTDGTNPPVLWNKLIAGILQDLIERGVVPDLPGGERHSSAFFLIFLDETLSLHGDAADPRRAVRGYFDTMQGHRFQYGIVPWAGVAEDLIGKGINHSVAAAQAVVAAMRGSLSLESEWIVIPEKPIAPSAPISRGMRWPSLIIEDRLQRFSIDEADIERCLEEFSAPLKIEDIPGSAAFFRRAAALVDARVNERRTRPRPASAVELKDFSRPLSRLTIAERLAALEATLSANHADVILVKRMLAKANEAALAELRKIYVEDGAFGFVDVVYWTYYKLLLARSLGLEGHRPMSIWDIGCGGGHFSLVCEYLGHQVLGTDQDHPVYRDIATALGVDRRIDVIVPNKATTEFGRKFDIVCANQIEFDRHHLPGGEPRFWSLDQWKFFLNDLIARQLKFPGRIHLALNRISHNTNVTFDLDLMRYCAAHGADVNERAGIIDWKLSAPIALP